MDKSHVERLLNDHTRNMANFLGLGHWTIITNVNRLDGDKAAICTAQGEYRLAHITFDSDSIHDEEGFIEYLAHELFHCVLWPINLYSLQSSKRLKDDSPEFAADLEVRRHVVEMQVSNLETIWCDHLRAAYLDWYTGAPPGRVIRYAN